MKKTNRIYENEFVQFIFLLIVTAIVLYFTPGIIQTVFFLFTLFLYFRSDKAYFWLVFALIMSQDIGGIYFDQTFEIINVGPVQFSYLTLFTLVSVFKYPILDKNQKFYLKIPIKIYFTYLIFLMYTGFFIYGNEGGGKSGLRNYFYTFFFILTILNIYTIPKILDSMKSVEKFTSLIFIAIIINFLGQMYHVVSGMPLYVKYGQLGVDLTGYNYILRIDKVLRPAWGHAIILLGISSAFLFYFSRTTKFIKKYNVFIILLCLFSVFIGATRGWIISISFMFLAFVFMNQFQKSFIIFSSAFVIFIMIINFSPKVKHQAGKAYDRFMTVEKIVEGDLTAGGTNSRLTDRSSKVLDVFYKYPIFGAGFSTEAMKKNDMHVGNQNILMAGGIVGFGIILFFWLYSVFKVLSIRSKLSKENVFKKALLFMPVIIVASILIHSSSTSLYGYLSYVIYNGKLFFIITFLVIINQFLLSALNFEKITFE